MLVKRLIQVYLFAGLFSFVTLAGCSGDGMPYEKESIVTINLYEFAKRGPRNATFRLEDATPFVWDNMFFFSEGVKKRVVNDAIGTMLFADNTEQRLMDRGPLLVFMSENEVAHAVVVIPPLFVSGVEKHAYSREKAVVVAHSKDPGPYVLRFQD